MGSVYCFYDRNLHIEKLIIKRMTIVQKVILLLLAVLFIYFVIIGLTDGEPINESLIFMLIAEVCLICSYNTFVNLVMVKFYSKKATWENAFFINWDEYEIHKAQLLYEELKKLSRNSESQIHRLIIMCDDSENEHRYSNVLTKGFSMASLIALETEYIKQYFNGFNSNQLSSTLLSLLVQIMIIASILYVIEIILGSKFNFFKSNKSRTYKKIKRTLEHVLIENYPSSNYV